MRVLRGSDETGHMEVPPGATEQIFTALSPHHHSLSSGSPVHVIFWDNFIHLYATSSATSSNYFVLCLNYFNHFILSAHLKMLNSKFKFDT